MSNMFVEEQGKGPSAEGASAPGAEPPVADVANAKPLKGLGLPEVWDLIHIESLNMIAMMHID